MRVNIQKIENNKFQCIKKLAIKLFKNNKIQNWKFEFDNARRRAGLCNYRKKTISLSKYYVEYAELEHIKDTILHEIAHALIGPRNGHNYLWKKTAISIGCSGARCHQLNFIKSRWIIYCKNGCFYEERHRKKSGMICKKCKTPVNYKKNI